MNIRSTQTVVVFEPDENPDDVDIDIRGDGIHSGGTRVYIGIEGMDFWVVGSREQVHRLINRIRVHLLKARREIDDDVLLLAKEAASEVGR